MFTRNQRSVEWRPRALERHLALCRPACLFRSGSLGRLHQQDDDPARPNALVGLRLQLFQSRHDFTFIAAEELGGLLD
jgi:hypothetical protein